MEPVIDPTDVTVAVWIVRILVFVACVAVIVTLVSRLRMIFATVRRRKQSADDAMLAYGIEPSYRRSADLEDRFHRAESHSGDDDD